MADPTYEIVCPCCGAILTVDAGTGDLLAHVTPPRKAHLSFEEAAGEVRAEKTRAESKFSKALEERSRQGEILEKKFRKALEKAADEPDVPPEKPFDLD
jgi:hypothetical protein